MVAMIPSAATVWRRPMPRAVRLALGLWLALAVTVFQVVFDSQTRMAAFRFSQAQLHALERGQPVATINEGFRPMVTAAARRAGLLAAGIAVLGCLTVAWAARVTPGDRA